MEDFDKQYVVTTPEEHFGEVAGKLTAIGARLEAAENINGVVTIQASAHQGNVSGFKEWLLEVTGGKGSFSENV